jgi:hypothetical protein
MCCDCMFCRSRWPRGLGRLVAGIAGSNPAGVYVVLSCVGRVLCDWLIARPKESYQVSKIYYKASRVRRQRSTRTVDPLMLMMMMTVCFVAY